MKAKDVMTPHIVTVRADNTVSEVADLLLTHCISAVPVVDDAGNVVGIVSEGDLIRRTELGTADRKRSWWLRLLTGNATLASEYVKSHATRVRDVMTKKVISVQEDTALSEIAALLEKHRIKRVPVLRDGRLVGIVSRANLIQGLAAGKIEPKPADLDDSAIRLRILEALKGQSWSGITMSGITVTDGVVEFWGLYGSDDERQASRVAAENVPGVRKVDDHRAHLGSQYGYV